MRSVAILALCVAAACGMPRAADDLAADEDKYKFPPGFLFGAGTSSYQTEGAWDADGKGPNVFDHYYHSTNTPSNETGDVASDTYGHYKEDIQLAADLGLNVLRFSISWARIFPDGKTANPNPKGVQHYHDFLAELSDKKIEPVVTLFHFDYPQALEDEFGGWLSDEMPTRFAEYADFAFQEYGAKIKHWLTVNEASFYCKTLGVIFFPQKPFNTAEKQNKCVRNTLLAHAKAYKIYHEKYFDKFGGMVGWGSGPMFSKPATDSDADKALAESFNLNSGLGLTIDPLVFGDYPESVRDKLIPFTDEEKKLLKGAVDFLGINCYGGSISNASSPSGGGGGPPGDGSGDGGPPPGDGGSGGGGHPGGFGSASDAWVLRELPLWIKDRYDAVKQLPIFFTENGVTTFEGNALDDWDTRAVYSSAFLREMLAGIHENGTRVIGYSAWSFVDTFEFKNGFSNWGMVHVDFSSPSLNRSLKASSTFFKTITRTGFVPLVEAGSDPFPDPDAPASDSPTTTSGPSTTNTVLSTSTNPSPSSVAALECSVLTTLAALMTIKCFH